MTKNTRSRSSALVEVIAVELERQLREDPRMEAAVASLQRLGYALTVRLEISPGQRLPAMAVSFAGDEVPEWTQEDRELLRSLGIALEIDGHPQSPTQPRRRSAG